MYLIWLYLFSQLSKRRLFILEVFLFLILFINLSNINKWSEWGEVADEF